MALSEEILTKYFDAQRELVEVETVDRDSVVVSLPLHFSGYTRVEVALTRVSKNQFLLSDMGRTIGELKDAGFPVGPILMNRIAEITSVWQVSVSGNTLVRTCNAKQLGQVLHELGEAAKTVGDAYLSIQTRDIERSVERTLKARIRETFNEEKYFFKEKQIVPGAVELRHRVDFYIPSNGSNGLALEVLPRPNRLQAEAWAWKTQDMKRADTRLLVGLVFDTAKMLSRTIIENIAEFSLSSDDLPYFASLLAERQVSKG